MTQKSMLAYKEDRMLTTQQLKKFSEHKYQCNHASLLDPWLQPLWNCLVSKTPLWATNENPSTNINATAVEIAEDNNNNEENKLLRQLWVHLNV
uniref:Uncharacterized protein n=1 Tax=Glossina pallidipes TaxID=7398 RepID=A0A1A9ZNT1_GLOPL